MTKQIYAWSTAQSLSPPPRLFPQGYGITVMPSLKLRSCENSSASQLQQWSQATRQFAHVAGIHVILSISRSVQAGHGANKAADGQRYKAIC